MKKKETICHFELQTLHILIINAHTHIFERVITKLVVDLLLMVYTEGLDNKNQEVGSKG